MAQLLTNLSQTVLQPRCHLIALPAETLHYILDQHLSRRADLCNIARCCQLLREHAQPMLFKTLTFGGGGIHGTSVDLEKFSWAVLGNLKLLRHVYELHIHDNASHKQLSSATALFRLLFQHCSSLQRFFVNSEKDSDLWPLLSDCHYITADRCLGLRNLETLWSGRSLSAQIFSNLFNTSTQLEAVRIDLLDMSILPTTLPYTFTPHPFLKTVVLSFFDAALVVSILNSCSTSLVDLRLSNCHDICPNSMWPALLPLSRLAYLALVNVQYELMQTIFTSIHKLELLEISFDEGCIQVVKSNPDKVRDIERLEVVGTSYGDINKFSNLLANLYFPALEILVVEIWMAQLLIPLVPHVIRYITIKGEPENQDLEPYCEIICWMNTALAKLHPTIFKNVTIECSVPPEAEKELSDRMVTEWIPLPNVEYCFKTARGDALLFLPSKGGNGEGIESKDW